MTIYIVKRLLFFIPTLVLISLISFFLMKMAPGDPVLSYMELDGEEVVLDINNSVFKNSYKRYHKTLNLDKPQFYFSLKPSNYPRSFPQIIDNRYDKLYKALLSQHSDNNDAINYIHHLQNIEIYFKENHNPDINHRFKEFLSISSLEKIPTELDKLSQYSDSEHIAPVKSSLQKLILNKKRIVLPSFTWNGIHNQYHYWLESFFGMRPLRSYSDGNPVISKINRSIKWTIAMVIPALLISFLLSIFIGVYQATHPTSSWTKWINGLNYFIFSIPTFWLATLLLIIFGRMSNLWGVGSLIKNDDSILMHISIIILPIIVIILHNMAYISRQMYHSMIKQSKEDYINTAKAKGVTNNTLTWKHQFSNALLPMITMMTAAIPASLSGSVVLELIYNIPGMGRLMYQSILQMDWPVVFGVLVFLSVISLFFMLIGDILYVLINPKIRFGNA